MSLAPGTQVGPYEIAGVLGAGGMGEVYRARDRRSPSRCCPPRSRRTPIACGALLEGETLRERVGGAPLPVRKAIEYAAQIARGLAAAHEEGAPFAGRRQSRR